MLPGPDKVFKCCACGKLVSQSTILSGNTFGARVWTDGKMDAPMLPEELEVVKCRHCRALLWVRSQEEVPYGTWGDREGEILPCAVPSVRDYFSMLDIEMEHLRRIKYLRIKAWHSANGKRRKVREPKPINKREKWNLIGLSYMLDENDEEERIMKAEVYRELGRFDDALLLLTYPFSSDYKHPADFIRTLAEKKDPFVKEIIPCDIDPAGKCI